MIVPLPRPIEEYRAQVDSLVVESGYHRVDPQNDPYAQRLRWEVGSLVSPDQYFFDLDTTLRVATSYSYADKRMICLPELEDELSYFASLHELGHAHFHHGGSGSGRRVMIVDSEAEAWEWGLDHALHEPQPETTQMCLWALSSYMRSTPDAIWRPKVRSVIARLARENLIS
jgi:hypothetical protein